MSLAILFVVKGRDVSKPVKQHTDDVQLAKSYVGQKSLRMVLCVERTEPFYLRHCFQTGIHDDLFYTGFQDLPKSPLRKASYPMEMGEVKQEMSRVRTLFLSPGQKYFPSTTLAFDPT